MVPQPIGVVRIKRLVERLAEEPIDTDYREGVERMTRFELATSTLGRSRSTN